MKFSKILLVCILAFALTMVAGCDLLEFAGESCQHVDENANGICDKCGKPVEVVCDHDYSISLWQSSDTHHWKICAKCNQIGEKQEHSSDTDGNCITADVCTICQKIVVFGQEQHVDADGDMVCDRQNCTQRVTPACAQHSFPQNVWQKDSIYHWQQCQNCSTNTTKQLHSALDTGSQNCTDDVLCVCGHLVKAGNAEHKFVKWFFDEDNHWHDCENTGCAVTQDDAPHVDENDDDICDVCNYILVEGGACPHVDRDSDTTCDVCGESVLVTVDLFGINDLHGKFLSSDSQPGVGKLTTYLEEQRKQNPTVVFASGDMWQGSAESGLTKGKIVNDWMKGAGFSFMTIGNHEFDWGAEYIQQNVSAELPFLAINIYDESDNQLADFCQPSLMVNAGGVMIGFIGAIGDCYSSISGEMSQGYYFKTGTQLTQLVKDEATRLREKGADLIVYSLHDGTSYQNVTNNKISDSTLSSYYDISLSDGYVDLVFEAHSHSYYVGKDTKGVWHVQCGGDNKSGIINAELSYNLVTDSYEIGTPSLITHSTMSSHPEHKIISELRTKYTQAITMMEQPIGTNSAYMNGSALSTLVSQLYAELATELTAGTSYQVVLGGGSINCRSPQELLAGSVTYADLYMLFPFDNRLALCRVDGATLKNQFINNSKYYVTLTSYGESIKNNISTSQYYYIITDSWNYTWDSYTENQMKVIKYHEAGVFARDLLADYFAGN